MSIKETRADVLREADEFIEKALGLLEPYASVGDAAANEAASKLLIARNTLKRELKARTFARAYRGQLLPRPPTTCGLCGRTSSGHHDIAAHAASTVSVYRDPAEKNADAWRVRVKTPGGDSRICTPVFNSRGAAYAYAGAIKDGERSPEW